MQAYTERPHVNNSDVPPAIPTYRWTLQERIDMSKRQTRRDAPHKGRGRRWRREVKTKQALMWLENARAGRIAFRGQDCTSYTLGELHTFPRASRDGPVVAFRGRVKTLLQQIDAHGPASGWGIPQPFGHGQKPLHWTPYMIPKAGEKCWRWWRGRVLALARVLRGLAWLLGKVVPPHRQPPSSTSAEKARALLRPCSWEKKERGTGTTSAPWVTLAKRSPHLFAM
ncbi:MAG: hypothetical protein Q8Q14_02925 [Gemmatimonadales bacterium]|nr:hypothetical protein [Gemmatimonadales bacterium]